MTKDEIIRGLQCIRARADVSGDAGMWETANEAIKLLEQEPCEDCVRRSDVVKWLERCTDDSIEHAIDSNLDFILSVTPQPKVGKWIFVHPLQEDDEGAYMCSCCGVGNWGIDPKVDKYCFNCGAKMEVEK